MDLIVMGNVIKQLRDNKKISQEVMSGLASIDRSNLANIELGHIDFKFSTLLKIADALDIKPSELLRAVEQVVDDK